MVVRSLEVNKDLFRLKKKKNEKLLGLNVSYFNVIYLANYTRLNRTFSINLLAKIGLSQLEDIRTKVNIYYNTFVKQVTLTSIIQKNQNRNNYVFYMQNIFQILIKLNLK